MEKITFCINTSKNEREYLELLMMSLLNGINVELHDIMIFVDSDNQNTTGMLLEQKSLFPNLTIVKNNGPAIGYQKNINWMFQNIKTNIASYIQSDMIVSLGYDQSLLSHLTDNMVLSGTRVEPPLHSKQDTAVNFVEDFGLTPSEFRYEDFLKFAEARKDPKRLINYFFAPFTLYKHVWNDIGGHDIQFVKSREDSDVLVRLCLNKVNIVQCWDAMVYHFTCTSSRGLNWWTPEEQAKHELQRQENDKVELIRFTRKWGQFMHPCRYEDVVPFICYNPDILNNIKVKNPPIDTSQFEYL